MTSTVTSSKASAKLVTQERAVSLTQKIQAINQSLLTPSYFPQLASLPNINYVTMATWALESSLRLLQPDGNSRHPGRSNFRDYLNSANYQSFLARQDLTTDQKRNIEEGFYAQGLTGAMGAYFIRDTIAADQLKAYQRLMDRLAGEGSPVQINLGESMTSLFSANDDSAIKASLAQGLIILNWKVVGLINSTYSSDPYKALIVALGAYLGWGTDVNGATGTSRIMQIATQGNPNLKLLARSGVVPTDPDVLYSMGLQVTQTRLAHSSKTPTSASSPSTVRVAQTNQPASKTNPECA